MIYTVALIAYSHKFAQSLALWSSETPGLSEITPCWKLCKHGICNMAREGALEGGSSVSGDLTCWTAFLCFGLDSFVIFSCLGLARSWKLGLVSCRRIDTGNLDKVRAAVGPSTKIVWIESPTNPRQMISDIRVSYTTSLTGILTFRNVVSLVRLELKEVSLG